LISVLVVDDSVVIRRLITDALSNDPQVRVIGTARNGRVALQKIADLNPDVVTLDIEMPEMDGLATLRALRRTHPRLPVIMFSTLTSSGAIATLDALAAGASDYVTKPANSGSVVESLERVRDQLIPRIHALCARPGPASRATRPAADVPHTARPSVPASAPGPRSVRIDIIAIGSSTGGPAALSAVLAALPATLPVPIVVVQHMPALFTRMLAERLDRECAVNVVEATSELQLNPGTVYIAPGDVHLEVARRGASVVTRLHHGPPENSCRPAVDVLFRSVAATYRASALAVVMTGMGQDGRRGSEVLVAAGSEVLAQDEASSVVWGMPGAVVGAGLAHAVVPLNDLAARIVARTSDGRPTRSVVVTR
jgi:two-component system chemotaxis response regulator CheB